MTYPHIIWPILNDKSLTNIDARFKNSDQIEELEYEEDFDVTEQLRKLDLELENDGEASELLNLGSFPRTLMTKKMSPTSNMSLTPELQFLVNE